jgi:hypothetical protein
VSIIVRMRRQTAVYWRRAGIDEYGQAYYDAPIEVDCRWDDAVTEFRNGDGDVAVTKSVVYPDRLMYVGDKMKLGSWESDTPDDPNEDTDAYEIKRMDQTPNLRATRTLFTAYLT